MKRDTYNLKSNKLLYEFLIEYSNVLNIAGIERRCELPVNTLQNVISQKRLLNTKTLKKLRYFFRDFNMNYEYQDIAYALK